jgi:HK97 gp10 family phage protein
MSGESTYIKVEGLEEVQRILQKLPDALTRRELLKMFRQAAKPVVLSAKANAPNDTGNLAESIGTITGKSKTFPTVYVGAKVKKRGAIRRMKKKGGKVNHYNTGGWYAHFVEYGISVDRKRRRRGKTGSTTAQPFMQKAIAQNKSAIEKNTSRVIKQFVLRHAKRLAKL